MARHIASFASFFLSFAVLQIRVASQPCPANQPRAVRAYNSWDADSNYVTEADILAAATFLQNNLLKFGFDTITVDGGWYSNETHGSKWGDNIIDAYGLPVPDVTRFPSSAGGKGLLPLAQQLNRMGLKLGAWTIRGITPEAFAADLPIKGSTFTARDVGVPPSPTTSCSWDPNTMGTNAPSAAADAWYESLAKHYVANGLELVKIDCMYASSSPQRYWWFQAEVESFAKAFAAQAPNVTISWSPGDNQTPAAAALIASHAPAWGKLYRITGDFHDSEGIAALTQHLTTAAFFAPLIGANGSFPDLDMLPFGQQAGTNGGPPRDNLFSPEEQRLIMTLWAITRAPLILGSVLPLAPDDNLTLSLFNEAVLDVNARSCRNAPTYVLPSGGSTNTTALFAWTASAAEGDATIVAFFNVRDEAASVSAASGVLGGCVIDVWTNVSEGALDDTGVLTRVLAPHSSGLWRVGAC
jgi:alpha-galactosidase